MLLWYNVLRLFCSIFSHLKRCLCLVFIFLKLEPRTLSISSSSEYLPHTRGCTKISKPELNELWSSLLKSPQPAGEGGEFTDQYISVLKYSRWGPPGPLIVISPLSFRLPGVTCLHQRRTRGLAFSQVHQDDLRRNPGADFGLSGSGRGPCKAVTPTRLHATARRNIDSNRIRRLQESISCCRDRPWHSGDMCQYNLHVIAGLRAFPWQTKPITLHTS